LFYVRFLDNLIQDVCRVLNDGTSLSRYPVRPNHVVRTTKCDVSWKLQTISSLYGVVQTFELFFQNTHLVCVWMGAEIDKIMVTS